MANVRGANQYTSNARKDVLAFYKNNPEAKLKVAELAAKIDRTPVTVRDIVAELIEEGVLQRRVDPRYINRPSQGTKGRAHPRGLLIERYTP